MGTGLEDLEARICERRGGGRLRCRFLGRSGVLPTPLMSSRWVQREVPRGRQRLVGEGLLRCQDIVRVDDWFRIISRKWRG